METRKTLLVCALTLAAFGCSDPVAPPASVRMTVNMIGDLSFAESVPDIQGNAVSLQLNETQLEMIEVLEDGDDGASIKCKVKELAKGSSYEISANYMDSTKTTQISLAATTQGNASAAGLVSVKSPKTGNTTYHGEACEVATALPKDGGGAIVVSFHCAPEHPLINQTNCGNPADCDDKIDGDVLIYIKNCGK